jgi:hypothetical protein
MDHPALRVPLAFATKLDGIADGKRNAWGEVDVVGHEDSHRSLDPNDEALVPAPLAVVREQPLDAAGSFHGNAGLAGLEGLCNLAGWPVG